MVDVSVQVPSPVQSAPRWDITPEMLEAAKGGWWILPDGRPVPVPHIADHSRTLERLFAAGEIEGHIWDGGDVPEAPGYGHMEQRGAIHITYCDRMFSADWSWYTVGPVALRTMRRLLDLTDFADRGLGAIELRPGSAELPGRVRPRDFTDGPDGWTDWDRYDDAMSAEDAFIRDLMDIEVRAHHQSKNWDAPGFVPDLKATSHWIAKHQRAATSAKIRWDQWVAEGKPGCPS